MSEWQPIETAPRDGSLALLYEDGHVYAGGCTLPDDDGESYWFARCGQPVVWEPEPTHWQPLPEPPK